MVYDSIRPRTKSARVISDPVGQQIKAICKTLIASSHTLESPIGEERNGSFFPQ